MAHDSAPLLVNKRFKSDGPSLALASENAKIWVHAFEAHPVEDILDIAKDL